MTEFILELITQTQCYAVANDWPIHAKKVLLRRYRFGIAMNEAAYCLILGFATEYSTSVTKFTATYVNPIARMQPCTR
jgi:hypothetical protein